MSNIDNYICSITGSFMSDPVMAPDGHNYERIAIEMWLRINPTSPMTRQPMSINQLVSNTSLKNTIDEYIKNNNIQIDYKQYNGLEMQLNRRPITRTKRLANIFLDIESDYISITRS